MALIARVPGTSITCALEPRLGLHRTGPHRGCLAAPSCPSCSSLLPGRVQNLLWSLTFLASPNPSVRHPSQREAGTVDDAHCPLHTMQGSVCAVVSPTYSRDNLITHRCVFVSCIHMLFKGFFVVVVFKIFVKRLFHWILFLTMCMCLHTGMCC